MIYRELTGMELPEIMRRVERRAVDVVLQRPGEPPRIVEVDESQYFNEYRAVTLRHYPRSLELAFDRKAWLERCLAKRKLEGGGFAAPKPPLFPGAKGRHKQRAYRDALCDILPQVHGFLPTLRIGDFEVREWIYGRDPELRMGELLQRKLTGGGEPSP